MTKGQTKGQKKVINKESSIYRFLEAYINKDNLVIDANIKDFIDILFSDMNKTQKRQKRCNLKKDIKLKKLSPTCRSFILFVNGNINKNINIQEIIIDKPPPIIKEKVKVKAEVIESESESEIDESDDDDSDDVNKDLGDGVTQVDMKKWRENQSQKFGYGVSAKEQALFTHEDLLKSKEWIELEKLNKIPPYVIKNTNCNSYFKGIHNGLVLIYDKLKT